jgi:hypothetical protein
MSGKGECIERNIARQNLIARLAALGLSRLCLQQGQIHAQGMTQYILLFPSVGLAPGQTLHLTLFNPDDTPGRAQARVQTSGANFLFPCEPRSERAARGVG